MIEAFTIPNKATTHARFVIASEARQSSALVGQSGLPRRYAPRNDGRV
jgi:hypothetical protein